MSRDEASNSEQRVSKVWGDTVQAWSSTGRKESLVAGGPYRKHVMVCQHKGEDGCFHKGGFDVKKEFNKVVTAAEEDNVKISSVGTMDFCNRGPVAVVYPDNIWYEGLSVEDVTRIFENHIRNDRPVQELTFTPDLPDDFRHVFVCTFMANCAKVDGGKIYRWFKQREVDDESLKVTVSMGCLKECSMGPVACEYPSGEWYTGLTEQKCEKIYQSWTDGEPSWQQTGKTVVSDE